VKANKEMKWNWLSRLMKILSYAASVLRKFNNFACNVGRIITPILAPAYCFVQSQDSESHPAAIAEAIASASSRISRKCPVGTIL
jgi:hypothetical protein